MAEDKISFDDIADLSKGEIEINKLLSAVRSLKKELIETMKATGKVLQLEGDSVDVIDQKTKALKESFEQEKLLNQIIISEERANQEANKTKIQAKKLLQEELKLKIAEQKEIEKATISKQKEQKKALQEELRLKVAENRESEKAAKAAAKEEKARQELASEYLKAQKRLTELSKKQREYAIRQELGNKLTREEARELKALTAEIQKLDKVLKTVDESQGKFQRSVGNYKKAVEGLKGASGRGGAFLGGLLGGAVGAQLSKGIDDIFSGTAEKAENFQLIVERTFNLISNVGVSVKNFIVGYAIPQFEKLALKVERAFTFDGDKLDAIDAQLKETNKTLASFKNPFDGIIDRIKETDELTKQQVKLRYEFIRQETLLSKQIQRRIGQEQVLAQIAEDDTLGFKTRKEAADALDKTQRSRLNLELQLAQKQLQLNTNLVKIGLEREGVATKFTDSQIQSLEFLKDEEVFRNTNLEALEALKASQLQYNQLQLDSNVFDAERAEKNRKAAQDALENELDYLKDRFDAQKAYNESIIGNDRIVFASRVSLLEQTKNASDKSYKDQETAINNFLKTQKGFAGKTIDLNELIKIDDAKALQEKIRGYNLSEKLEQVILQSIREKQTANKDFYESDKSLAQEKRERDQRIADSVQAQEQENFDFAVDRLERQYDKEEYLQDQAFIFRSKNLNSIAKKEEAIKQQQLLDQFDFDKAKIETEIVEADEKAQKIREIEAKLQHDLQKLNDDTTKQVADNNRKQFLSRLEFIQKTADEFVSALQNELQQENDARQANLDRQIDQREKNVQAQQDLFNKGQQNQLAFEKEQQAKLELQRKDAEEKAARQIEALQLIQATYQAYITRLKQPNSNPSTAALQAVGDAVLIKALAKGVAGSFFEGTDDTGTVANPLDTKGGRLSILHDNEQVWSQKDREQVGWRTRDELIDIVKWFDNGTASNIASSIPLQSLGTNEIVSEIKGLRQEMSSRPTQVFSLDEFDRIVEVKVNSKIKTKTTYHSNPWK